MTDLVAHFPTGLDRQRYSDYRQLIERVTHSEIKDPFLAGTLFLSDPLIRAELSLPFEQKDQVVIHDYQSVEFLMPTQFNGPLNANLLRSKNDFTITFSDLQGDVQKLKTGLRVTDRVDIETIKPMVLSDTRSISDLGHLTEIGITQRDVTRYQDISGDHNPIHHDEEFARALGFEKPIVPGLFLLAFVQPLTDVLDLQIASLRARFVAPLMVGENLKISLQQRANNKARGYFLTENNCCVAMVDFAFEKNP